MKYAVSILTQQLEEDTRLLDLHKELVEANKIWIQLGRNVEYNTTKLNENETKVKLLQGKVRQLHDALFLLDQ